MLETAERKQDEPLLRRIWGFDLFACEAKFHPSYRRSYLRYPSRRRSQDEQSKAAQGDLERSHQFAFEMVCSRVEQEIIQQHNVLTLSDLCDTYINYLKETGHFNMDYRPEKLKRKIENRDTYRERLRFVSPKGQAFENRSSLVYSAEMSIKTAILTAYQPGSSDSVKNIALELQTSIHLECI